MLLFQSPPPLSSSKGIAVSNAANFIMLCCHICAWYLFYFELRPCFTVEALYDLFANWVFSQSSLCRSMLHVLVLPLTKHVQVTLWWNLCPCNVSFLLIVWILSLLFIGKTTFPGSQIFFPSDCFNYSCVWYPHIINMAYFSFYTLIVLTIFSKSLFYSIRRRMLW